MKTFFKAFALALAFGAVAAPGAIAETPIKSIRLADFDLSRPADVAKLAHRIKRASAEVCENLRPDANPNASAFQRYSTCRTTALNSALRTISNPQLTALFPDAAPAQLALR